MDKLTAARRSENMRRIKSKHSKPELIVRQTVFAMGFRYRLHRRDLPGQPDLVFPAKRKVVFVHGCFWHLHDGCREGRVPRSNRAYWSPKLQRNRERDRDAQDALIALGWDVLVVWECETVDRTELSSRLESFLSFHAAAHHPGQN